jgi:UDPglucose 6-dehydrogenase
MREAPSRALMEALWAHGAVVQAFDPLAMEETRRLYPDQERLVLAPNATAALQGADALVIATEWNLFRSPDFALMRQCLRRRLIIDGRNLYDPELLARHGLVYDAIGRSPRTPVAEH